MNEPLSAYLANGDLESFTPSEFAAASRVLGALARQDPAPQSSVTLTQGAKGDTRVEVKVYANQPSSAARLAQVLYDELVAKYRQEGAGA